MKRRHSILKVILVACVFILICYGWLALGVFQDREFSDLCVFSKHTLSPRLYFYSPIGESDKPMTSLTLSEQKSETTYIEFIEDNHGYQRKICFLP